jgi:hypothetical protein
MKRYLLFPAATVLLFAAGVTPALAMSVFFNELHYDNAWSDKGEGIEIAGVAGIDLDGYEVLLYNGGNGQVYASVSLDGVIGNQQGGFGTLFFGLPGMQNGSPDGMALVDPNGDVLQFLSYEGSFAAVDGAASGLVSIDIGVSESSDQPLGMSLQLAGTGTAYGDFVWAAAQEQTYGMVNAGQSFAPVPLPPAVALFAGALGGFGFVRRRV